MLLCYVPFVIDSMLQINFDLLDD